MACRAVQLVIVEVSLDRLAVARSSWIERADQSRRLDHELGPEAGTASGRVVATGTPEDLARAEGSITGQRVREMLPAGLSARYTAPNVTPGILSEGVFAPLAGR